MENCDRIDRLTVCDVCGVAWIGILRIQFFLIIVSAGLKKSKRTVYDDNGKYNSFHNKQMNDRLTVHE